LLRNKTAEKWKMSSEMLVSKSPFILGRFEWDTKIPPHIQLQQNEHININEKWLKIVGQDGCDYKIFVGIYEDHRVNVNEPRPFVFIFWFDQIIKGNVEVEMKMLTKNAKPKTLIHQNSRLTPLVLRNCAEDRECRLWNCLIKPSVKKCEVTIDLQIEIEKYIEPEDEEAKAKMIALSDAEPSLTQTLQDLHLNEESSDITIRCDNETFPCHKFILGSRSDVFKTMFTMTDSKEEQNGIIEIEDISAKTMKTFLKFMYKDDLEIEEIDCNLLIAAEKYNFKRLFNICLKQIEKMINANTVMEITIASYLIDNEQLLLKASEFIFKNRGSIRKCELWDQIRKKNPAIAAKVMDLMVFDEE